MAGCNELRINSQIRLVHGLSKATESIVLGGERRLGASTGDDSNTSVTKIEQMLQGKIDVAGIQDLTAVKTIQGNKLNDFLEDGFRKKINKNKKRKFKKR